MSDHPPLPALRTDPLDPEIVAHLEVCPRCRVELRLLQEASQTDAATLVGLDEARAALQAIEPRGRAALSDSLSTTTGEAMPALVPGQKVERYVVEAQIGAGGMGIVYRVRHAKLGSLHALKLMHGQSPREQARLLREGRAQSRLRHPNVVAVTDVIEVDGAPGLIMDFVDGPSLAEWLLEEQPPLDVADRWARGILRGVRAAHRAGFVHRDLKPGNVLLAPGDEGFEPRVTDFGLVRVTEGDEPPLTRTGTTLGTPSYMAPEQIRDASRADERSDLFSLGAVLYEMVTGVRAFPLHGLVDVWERMRDGAYTPPEDLVPDLPERMGSTIRRALRPDPADRFEDCDAMLAAWVGGVDRRESPARRRWPVVAAVAGLVALVATLAVFGPRRTAPVLVRPSNEVLTGDVDTTRWGFAVSGDGAHMAFIDDGSIWRMDIGGGPPQRLADGNYTAIDFLPDGATLLAAGPDGVWRVGPGGTTERLADVGARGLKVSPDGTHVLLVDGTGVWLAGPDATERRLLVTAERIADNFASVAGVAWSPDGRSVATLQNRVRLDSKAVLEITAVDGGSTRRVADLRAPSADGSGPLAWVQPDTLLLGFGLDRPATLRMVPDAHEAGPEAFEDPALAYTWPDNDLPNALAASRDGRRIVYSRMTAENLVRLVPTDTPQKAWTAPGFTQAGFPTNTWPSADEVVVVVQQGRQWGLYVQPVRRPDARLLASDVMGAIRAGDALLMWRLHDSGTHPYASLLRMPLPGGSERELARFPTHAENLPWIRCSSEVPIRCVAAKPEGERLQFREFDPVTGKEGKPLRTVDMPTRRQAWDLSPDGSLVALGRLAEVRIIDLATGAERSLPVDLFVQFVAWTSHADAVDVSGIRRGGGFALLEVPVDGDVRSLWQSDGDWIDGVSPSPDGKLVAIGTRHVAQQFWLLEGATGQ